MNVAHKICSPMVAFVMPGDGLRMGLPEREGHSWNERETSRAFDGHMSYCERLESRRISWLVFFPTRYLSDRVVWGSWRAGLEK